ncbi:DUF917 domain-containing protein [Ornithinimicrobium cavernae]|uniref:DUF917 domain-containing protein n=1 Tax=Ornithinimicrobium cavernae TaxID=2666047 RepID=UPI00137AA16A|nr:DUF917 domain-containing protein [Ornithinimicrobium cavernae]
MRLSVESFDELFAGSQLGVISAASTSPGYHDLWVRDVWADRGPVELVAPEDVDRLFGPDDLAACVGMVGSLTAVEETPFRDDAPLMAVRELERVLGRRVAALAPLNASGPNLLLTVAAACLTGLPLLDCDGQGQILPLIDQTTYTLGGLSAAPLAGVGPWGDIVTLQCAPERTETLTRAAVSGAGGWLCCALYPSPVRTLVAAGIPGAVSRSAEAGRLLVSDRDQLGSRLAQQLGGRILGRGRVREISQHRGVTAASRQPARPVTIVLDDLAPQRGELQLEVRNEAVLVLSDGAVAAAAPDIICLLDPLRRRMVDMLELKAGDVVEILVLPANERWYTPAGVELAGPASFGLPINRPATVP